MKLLKYTYVHEFNRIFMLGDFKAGVSLMNRIKPGLEDFIAQLDNHREGIIVLDTVDGSAKIDYL